jgi:ribosome-associated toxin RatA of RatAB toxin-antitoxin module
VVGCRVSLALDFEPRSGLAGLALAPLVEQTASSLVDAFVARVRS